MGEPWAHRRSGPLGYQARRIPLAALAVEMRLTAGAQALPALITCARERAGTLEAHAAAQGLFTRRRPMGVAAMQRSVAQRGTGDGGPAVPRADGGLRPREQTLRGRDDGSRLGPCAGARTCDRRPGAPGIVPLAAPVNRPARGDASFVPAWMTVVAVAPPVQKGAACFTPRCALDVAERGRREVATEAPQDDAGVDAPRPVPPADRAGALLVVRVDGTGGPMLTADVATLTATWGTGEPRQQQQDALVGGSDPGEPTPRSPAALAARLVAPAAARARRPRDGTREAGPRAQQVRRVASLGRTQPAVMAGSTADAERRDPPPRTPVVVRRDGALGRWHLAPQLFTSWQRVPVVRDSLPVVGSLWRAAHAWCGDASRPGQPWVPQQLTAMWRGRVGSVLGGRRHILTQPPRRTAGRETRASVITGVHHHRRWRHDAVDLAVGLPVGPGVGASAGGAVVKPRREGDGTRWRLDGAEAMLTWRSRKKSHDDDLRDDWRFRAGQRRGRLSGHTPH